MQESSKNWQGVFRCWIKIISTFLKIHYPYTLYSRVNKKSFIGSVSEFFFNRVPYVCARQFPQKVERKRKGEGEKGKRKVKKKRIQRWRKEEEQNRLHRELLDNVWDTRRGKGRSAFNRIDDPLTH